MKLTVDTEMLCDVCNVKLSDATYNESFDKTEEANYIHLSLGGSSVDGVDVCSLKCLEEWIETCLESNRPFEFAKEILQQSNWETIDVNLSKQWRQSVEGDGGNEPTRLH